jgi:hypothetical protein
VRIPANQPLCGKYVFLNLQKLSADGMFLSVQSTLTSDVLDSERNPKRPQATDLTGVLEWASPESPCSMERKDYC